MQKLPDWLPLIPMTYDLTFIRGKKRILSDTFSMRPH